jgi:phosphohistidine swiveling domain-containing protein
MGNHVISLDSKSALQVQNAGGKGASLAWLRSAGFEVPPGFVVTTRAFDDMLKAVGIRMSANGKAWAADELAQVRQRISTAPIPQRLAVQIGEAYQGLGSVAVRSSMVGEDAVVTSFAGQLDTLLNVNGLDAVLDALRQCWASLFNWRLSQYLNQHQANGNHVLPRALSMAVVVQQMVDAKAAGVAFSADPVTAQANVIIEAARGLGVAVVQGLVQPDRYVVDIRNVLAQTTPVDKAHPVMEEEQILRLAPIVRDAAGRRGCPQDIEWAWDGTSFHLLQCRPITSLVGKTVYSNRMVSEMVPGLIKPLVWDQNTKSMIRNVFGRIFSEVLGDSSIDYDALVKRIHSRLYVNGTLMGSLFERLGMPGNFFEMVTRDETAQRRRRMPIKNLGAVGRLLRFAWHNSRVVDPGRNFVQRHQADLEPYRRTALSDMQPLELLSHYQQLAELHGETQWYVFIAAMNMNIRNRILTDLAQRNAPDVVPSDLIRGLVGTKALEPNLELQKLGAQAAALDSQTQSVLAEGDDRTIRQHLSASEQGQALLRGVDGFLQRYGFLSTCGTDFAGVSWSEDPRVIWQCIARAVASGAERPTEDAAAIREAARRRVRGELDLMHRVFFDRLLPSTAVLIDLRERVSMLFSEDMFEMRRIFLAVADHLVAGGRLAQGDDIFYLTHEEILQLVNGELEPGRAQEALSERRAEMERDAQVEPPDTVCGEQVPTSAPTLAEDQEYLVGIRGSSGVVSGRACIVLEPGQAPVGLTRDDILVVPFTDVSWTPLLSGIGGIVAETGGQLSHAAIVAREYGVPAVVNVKQATRLIQDGWRITVDGDNGRVVLDRRLSGEEDKP